MIGLQLTMNRRRLMPKRVTEKSTKAEILSVLKEMEEKLKEEKAKANGQVEPTKTQIREEKIEKVKEVTVDSVLTDLAESKVGVMKVFESLTNLVIDKQEEYKNMVEAIKSANDKLGDISKFAACIEHIEHLESLKEEKEKAFDIMLEDLRALYHKKDKELTNQHQEELEEKRKNHSRKLEQMNYEYSVKERDAKQKHDNQMELLRTEVEALRTEKEEYDKIKEENLQIPQMIADAVNKAEGKLKGQLEAKFERDMKMKQLETANTLELKEQRILQQSEEIARLNKDVSALREEKKELADKLQLVATAAIESKSQTPQIYTVTSDKK